MKFFCLLLAVTFLAFGDLVSADCFSPCLRTSSSGSLSVQCSQSRSNIECVKEKLPLCSAYDQVIGEDAIKEAQKVLSDYCGACGLTSSLSVCLALSAIAYFFKRDN